MKKQKHVKASLTVETALVLPVFIFAIISFIYFLQILYIQEILQNAITETGNYATKYAYVYDYLVNLEEDKGKSNSMEDNTTRLNSLEAITACSIDSTFYKEKIKDFLDVTMINHSCIKNGYAGIHTYLSSFMQEDTIDIILIYKVEFPIVFFKLKDIQMVQRVRMHGWTGHKVAMKNSTDEDQSGEEGDEIVYITDTGTVYHLTKDCTHLKLSVKQVSYDELPHLRNDSGGKYKECEICDSSKKSNKSDCIYITNSGDRYHWDLNCSGLKRTIKEIPRSQIGNRTLCKRCGAASK